MLKDSLGITMILYILLGEAETLFATTIFYSKYYKINLTRALINLTRALLNITRALKFNIHSMLTLNINPVAIIEYLTLKEIVFLFYCTE